jgi:predicted transcriptional regulator
MSESKTSPNYIELAAHIVSAYVSNNSVPATDLPVLLQSIHAALTNTEQGQQEELKAELIPAVSVKKSLTPDYIVRLEDGKKFKSLKRHLRTTYDGSVANSLFQSFSYCAQSHSCGVHGVQGQAF